MSIDAEEDMKKLANAVILQAMMDAVNFRIKAREQKEARIARLWLLCDNTDFPYWCDLAGRDPKVVRARAQAIIMRRWALKEKHQRSTIREHGPAQLTLDLVGVSIHTIH